MGLPGAGVAIGDERQLPSATLPSRFVIFSGCCCLGFVSASSVADGLSMSPSRARFFRRGDGVTSAECGPARGILASAVAPTSAVGVEAASMPLGDTSRATERQKAGEVNMSSWMKR